MRFLKSKSIFGHAIFLPLVGGWIVFAAASSETSSVVKLVHKDAQWTLLLNGKPYYVKGISCNEMSGEHGEDFLKMAADAGANTVRIYGDVTPAYLDRAAANGLHVNVGFWLDAIRHGTKKSYRDPVFCATLRQQALAMVHQYKTHPAVLAWTLGNEVFSFTEAEEEKQAFGVFLEDLVQRVHQEDPNHPVIYASSYSRCLPDLKRWVPSIDIVGVNVTGGAAGAIHWCDMNQFDRPVLVTEFAPFGSWEQRKDGNGLPYDPFDQFKADNLDSSWRQIQGASQRCLGGFAFVLGGLRNQDSLTWYNMNDGALKRASYWKVFELYTGQRPPHALPEITMLTVTPQSGLKGGQTIDVSVTASDREPAALRYDYFITNIAVDPLIVEKPVFYPDSPQVLADGHVHLTAPDKPGAYRVYAEVKDPYGNVAIADHSVVVKE